MDSWGNGVYSGVGNGVSTKKCTSGNAYACINCTSPIDTARNFWTIGVV